MSTSPLAFKIFPDATDTELQLEGYYDETLQVWVSDGVPLMCGPSYPCYTNPGYYCTGGGTTYHCSGIPTECYSQPSGPGPIARCDYNNQTDCFDC
jgi:hypothetical protein